MRGVGGIDEDDDPLEHALSFELPKLGQGVLFFLAEGQVVAVLAVGAGAPKVAALAAAPGEDKDRRVAVGGEGALYIRRVDRPGHFVDLIRALGGTAVDVGDGADITAARAGVVEVPQDGVDGQSHALQRVLEPGGGGGIH